MKVPESRFEINGIHYYVVDASYIGSQKMHASDGQKEFDIWVFPVDLWHKQNPIKGNEFKSLDGNVRVKSSFGKGERKRKSSSHRRVFG